MSGLFAFGVSIRTVKAYKQRMEKIMSDKEFPRDKRIPVLLTNAERKTLQRAANRAGLGLSTFIRAKALEAIHEKSTPDREPSG